MSLIRFTTRACAATLFLCVAACGPKGDDAVARAAADAQAPRLPVDDSVAIRLANEASALFSDADTFPSGRRHCLTLPPGEQSERCALLLRVRTDVETFGPGSIPDRFVVLAAVENQGDLTDVQTRIPGGVRAYVLVEQGSTTRADGWYFSVDSGDGGRVVVIRRVTYVACQHVDQPQKPLGAWRDCSQSPPTLAELSGPALEDPDSPAWMRCAIGCCLVDDD